MESLSNKPSNNKRYYWQPFILHPNSLITPFDGLKTALLATYNKAKEEVKDFGGNWLDPRIEYTTNQAFLNNTSDFNTDKSSSNSSFIEKSKLENLQKFNESLPVYKNRMYNMTNT